ncbi:MAG TPA: hypothetical protein VMS17_19885 [Gemmataceae bacterium]|nr:hypothetical protein [Gemmataceae bacterium]
MPGNDLITLARAREAVLQCDEAAAAVVAPLGCRGRERSWEGAVGRKPWQYQITAAIPHLETPETLPVLLELLALQTVRPYVLLIDTGSSPAVVRRLEALRRPDVEIHYLRGHGYAHSSAPVTTAMDVAFALCRTPYLFCTHSDVFPRRRDLLEWLLGLCREEQPVVGYEMSPRPGTNGWRNVVSHTCTLLDMRVMRRIGATWSFERYWESGEAAAQQHGYPDTEQPFDRCLRRAGIFPYLIGHDANHVRLVDDNIDHVRSLAGLNLYEQGRESHRRCRWNLDRALGEAQIRIRAWRKEARHG